MNLSYNDTIGVKCFSSPVKLTKHIHYPRKTRIYSLYILYILVGKYELFMCTSNTANFVLPF